MDVSPRSYLFIVVWFSWRQEGNQSGKFPSHGDRYQHKTRQLWQKRHNLEIKSPWTHTRTTAPPCRDRFPLNEVTSLFEAISMQLWYRNNSYRQHNSTIPKMSTKESPPIQNELEKRAWTEGAKSVQLTDMLQLKYSSARQHWHSQFSFYIFQSSLNVRGIFVKNNKIRFFSSFAFFPPDKIVYDWTKLGGKHFGMC